MNVRRAGVVLLSLMLACSFLSLAQEQRNAETGVEERLSGFAARLRLSISLASFAVYAPSLGDLHLHAQQIVNALEGSAGPHFVRAEANEEIRGLRPDVADLIDWFGDNVEEGETKLRIAAATRNIATYLELALESALQALRLRRLDEATAQMLKVYAFLAAAYERPSETPHVPGLWTILRQYSLAESEAGLNADQG